MWCNATMLGVPNTAYVYLKGRENKGLKVEAATLMKFLGWLLKCFFKYLPRKFDIFSLWGNV